MGQHSQKQKLASLVSLLFLTGFILITITRISFTTVNVDLNSWAVTIQTSFLTALAEGIAIVFDTLSLLVVSLAATAILLTRHRRLDGVFLLGAMGGDAILVGVIKTLVHSPRPANMLIVDSGYSFPSGHATASVVFFGVLTYLAWQRWNSPKLKLVTVMLDMGVALLVGLDRIYLNVHWFSDVLGGYFLGAFWLTFMITMTRHYEQKSILNHSNI
jgi:undecaprenyl-diphosphatase